MAMHAAIARDLRGRTGDGALLIHLGDYIDRGPDSAGCLSIMAAGRFVQGVPTVNLMGNHEAMLLSALDRQSADAAELWIGNGGDLTLASWGIDPDAPVAEWARQIPGPQLDFMRGLALHHVAGGFAFVHAGVRPGVPLARQRAQDLLWIREGFLDWDGPMLPEAPELTIVHGHTPAIEPVVRRNRIGIDTGAGVGRLLTCAVLGDGRPRFLQV